MGAKVVQKDSTTLVLQIENPAKSQIKIKLVKGDGNSFHIQGEPAFDALITSKNKKLLTAVMADGLGKKPTEGVVKLSGCGWEEPWKRE